MNLKCRYLLLFAVAFLMISKFDVQAKVTTDIDLGTNVIGTYDSSTYTLTIKSNNGCLDKQKLKDFFSTKWVEHIKTAADSTDLKIINGCGVYYLQAVFSGHSGLIDVDLNNIICQGDSLVGMFSSCKKLKSVKLSFSNTQKLNSMSNMFYGCKSLQNVELSNLDTSNVTDMGGLFCHCNSLQSIDVSNFDTSKVTNMNSMFGGCSSLQSIDVSNFDTSNVTIMIGMFEDCSSLKTIDVSNFNTSNVTDMASMFGFCSSLQSLDLSSFDTSKVEEMHELFCEDTLPEINIRHFNVNNCDERYIDIFYDSDIMRIISPQNPDKDIPLAGDFYKIENGVINFDTVYTKISAGSASATYVAASHCDKVTAKVSGVDTEYDGNAHAISISVTSPAPRYKVAYSIDGKTYSEENPSFTDIGTYTVYYSVTATNYVPLRGSENITIRKCNMENASVTLSNETYKYDGTPKTPSVIVNSHGNTLVEGKDYTISYANNINEGIASVKVTGIGFYQGSKTVDFEIKKCSLNNATVELSQKSFIYDGTAKTPKVVIKYNNKTLTENNDYILTYSNNIDEGTASVTISGKGAYKGSRTVEFKIIKNSMSDATIELSQNSFVYDGTEKLPSVVVMFNDKTLAENTDYTLAYSNNIEIGTANVTVSGIGSFSGQKSIDYSINGISIEKAAVTLNETVFTYDGSPKMPEAVVVLDGTQLTKNTDFVLNYKDNINAGTAYVIISGMGHYAGEISQSFKILEHTDGSEGVYDTDSTIISNSLVYTIMDGNEHEVEVTRTNNKKAKNVKIPATVEKNGITYKVTSIGEKAFYKNKYIQKVTIGNNVQSIENYAFYGCTALKSVKIGNGLEVIGASAFRKCTALKSIVLPKSIDSIGKYSFHGCKKLGSITIKANAVIDIGDKAISGISKKAVIHVPKKLVKKYGKKFTAKTGYKKTMKIKK